jgi:RimJ/RimL family protein N-acetyltransferase
MKIKIKNEETVLIREATGADAVKILDYIETISGESDFLTFGLGEFTLSTADEAKFLEHTARQNNAIYLLAEINGKIVGTANFSGGSRPRIAHVGEISVSVLKKYWGNGIGTALLKYIINWSKQSGVIRKLNLRVRSDNLAAIHVYKKLGFIEEGVTTRQFLIDGKFYGKRLVR